MKAPRYLSLFTGAGGVDLGLDAAGWECIGQCEIDDTARSVLDRHWPDVPKWVDVRDVAHPDVNGRRGPMEGIAGVQSSHGEGRDSRPSGLHAGVDLIVGGFPCQDVSVAGRRAGLAGERSGLWWEFHRIVESVRPRAVLVENVEGLLSSNGGRDLGSVVDALVELGYGVAWRVLDAQHFGVPQRRRRVFLLAFTGGRVGAERAAQVLALTPGGGGDPAPRRGARPDAAGDVGDGAPGLGGHRGSGLDPAPVLANSLTAGGPGKMDSNGAEGHHLVPARYWVEDCESGPLRAFHALQDPISGDVSPALGRGNQQGASTTGVTDPDHGVRRLTPVECERLMGWPDDHTRYAADGGEIADSRRYAMCGNGVVAPVAEWIGARLAWELARDNEFEPAA